MDDRVCFAADSFDPRLACHEPLPLDTEVHAVSKIDD